MHADLPSAPHARLDDTVYSLLLKDIGRAEFPATGKLASELDLAKRFGVSRPTVRQAIARLRSEGVVASRRGAGTYVVRPPVPPVDAATGSIESIADVDRYYAFRMCVEGGAAESAAEMRDDDDLRTVRSALLELHRAIDASTPAVEQDIAFHLAIARASHNQFFVHAVLGSIGPIRQCIELARRLSEHRQAERNRQVQREHERIVDALTRRSRGDAGEAMRRHIAMSRRRLFEGT